MAQVKRRRRSKRIREGAGEVPTSSFADIAFLLIIYFLVVTTLIQTRGLVADMPAGRKTEAADMEKVPTVTVADGAILLNDNPVSVDDLRAKLAEMNLPAREPDDRVVMLEATGRTDYQAFYDAVAAIQVTGGVIANVQEAEGGEEGGQ